MHEVEKVRRETVERRGPDQSMLVASVRVLEAGINLLCERLDLVRADLREAIKLTAARKVWLLAASVAFFFAWGLFVVAIVVRLVEIGASVSAGVAAGGLLAGVSGGALFALSRRRMPTGLGAADLLERGIG